jgi:exopolysaccharide biosynthesis polyprenyl glycosylphosphotransferase
VFKHFGRRHLEFAGVISACGYEFDDPAVVLGNIDDFEEVVRSQQIDRLLCTGAGMNSPAMREALCHMRYSGVPVASLASLCEEVYQFVPLELVTPEWLLGASEWPQMLYIRKLKRAFDIIASLAGLALFSPIIVSGIIAVAVTSKGPVFYRQVRSGRFGKPFTVFKLRSMRVDAEAGGAQWSSVKGDPRVTRVGKFLRKYRIDEIPQLLNVLRGEMSFVGPRPERPEFVEKLSEEIPLMSERLFVQPGLTGWAQVNYPYGASLEDARRKLEYDLYYMKHMSVFLDLFILLDTVWIVLRGGLGEQAAAGHPLSNAIREHIHAEPEPDAS